MEVHAHTHTPRKKWTHYLWEFLMLFLAVFCGFLAEYQLEHKIEKDRELQYIKSLVNDIKADTVRMNQILRHRNQREINLDSVTLLLNSKTPDNYSAQLYFFGVTISRSLAFRFLANDGTMQQLKNSGGFRLIKKQLIADSIAKYDVSIRSLIRQGELEELMIQDYRGIAPKFYNALVFDSLLDSDNNPLRLTHNPPLLTFQKSDLEVMNYRLYSMKVLNKAMRRDMKLLLRQSEALLSLLKEKYHL
jgi:hypothetical protein